MAWRRSWRRPLRGGEGLTPAAGPGGQGLSARSEASRTVGEDDRLEAVERTEGSRAGLLGQQDGGPAAGVAEPVRDGRGRDGRRRPATSRAKPDQAKSPSAGRSDRPWARRSSPQQWYSPGQGRGPGERTPRRRTRWRGPAARSGPSRRSRRPRCRRRRGWCTGRGPAWTVGCRAHVVTVAQGRGAVVPVPAPTARRRPLPAGPEGVTRSATDPPPND